MMCQPNINPSTLSIYVHIPFCASKCRYCDFYSIRYDSALADAYIDALAHEWELTCKVNYLYDYDIITLYFGGGTPSVLSLKQWEKIGKTLIPLLNRSKSIEWSVECNPESFSEQLADLFLHLGVNRLTFGVQSLCDKELSVTGRAHDAQTAMKILQSSSLSGFRSIGADLIYGLPGQTLKSLQQSLYNLMSSKYINHCSAYELTINNDTPFGRHLRLLPLPDDDTIYEMTSLVRSFLKERGFKQYEVSNYAKPEFRCRHNSIYWDHQNYVGLGCAAHSYLHSYRWANADNIHNYLNILFNNELPQVYHEYIDQQTLIREMIFLGLRRVDGINTEIFENRVQKKFHNCVDMQKVEQFILKGWLDYKKPVYLVTETGLLFADTMARELF